MIATILGALLIVAGILTLVFAGKNIGFPVFNVGPLLTGLVVQYYLFNTHVSFFTVLKILGTVKR